MLYRNVHTGSRQGKELGPIVSFCAGPVPCTCPGSIPYSVNEPLNKELIFSILHIHTSSQHELQYITFHQMNSTFLTRLCDVKISPYVGSFITRMNRMLLCRYSVVLCVLLVCIE